MAVAFGRKYTVMVAEEGRAVLACGASQPPFVIAWNPPHDTIIHTIITAVTSAHQRATT